MNPQDLFPELKDVRPPVEAVQTPWLLIAAAAALILLAAAALVILFRKKKSSPAVLSPADEALAQLDAIRMEDLHRMSEAAEFYRQLSMVLRRFIERRFDIHAPEMTTEEFLLSLREHAAFADRNRVMIEAFLCQCDLVKFAQHAPDPAEARRNFEMVKDFIGNAFDGGAGNR